MSTMSGSDQRRPTNQLDECLWASSNSELQKACYLARVCRDQPPRKCQFYRIASIRQEGPTCGLTALSMLLGGRPTPDELLATAQQRHYTYLGEMFSAQNLFRLLCDTLRMPAGATRAKECDNVLDCQLHHGLLNCAKVQECLLAGACLFVPYDPDFNHTPCLKFGHKAHWALIIGYLIDDMDEFYVIARHGKAKNLAVWSLEALSESNSNLLEFIQPRGYPDCDFLLPPGGIDGDMGLRKRAIIVNGLKHETLSIS